MLKSTVSGRADLVEVAKATLEGNTFRLQIDWPKSLRGEQPIEVSAPDVAGPLRLLVKRTGGRATADGLRVRASAADEAQQERLERLIAGDASAEAEDDSEAGAAAPASDAEAADEEPAAEDEAPESDEQTKPEATAGEEEGDAATESAAEAADEAEASPALEADAMAAEAAASSDEAPASDEPATDAEPASEEEDSEAPARDEATASAQQATDDAPASQEEGSDAAAQPGPKFGEVRTGRTLPPPSTAPRKDERTGDTLRPQPAEAPGEPTDKPELTADAGEEGPPPEQALLDEAAQTAAPILSEIETTPEIEYRPASSIPPEFIPQPGDEDEDELAEDYEPRDGQAAPEPEHREDEQAVDDEALEAFARTLLAGDPAADDRPLRAAGEQGALALCRARVGATVDAVGRSRFLACMRELGEDALPAIRETLDAALADATRLNLPAALEDLLRAAPDTTDDELAELVAPMCTHANHRVRHAAIAALPKLNGERAKPVLRNALRDADESVCRAAIAGLRRVRGIDVLALVRLEPLLTGDEEASDELRAQAAAALVDVDAGQRDAALDALHRALNPRTSMVSLFVKTEESNPMLVEAICRTMLVIGGSRERRTVTKHAARSRQPLRQRLEALVRLHAR